MVQILRMQTLIMKRGELVNQEEEDDREFNFLCKIDFNGYIADFDDFENHCLPCNNDCCVGCKFQDAPTHD